MTAYETELHKLVECDDYQSEYYQQLERLGQLFDDLTGCNASINVAIAEEVCFRALELVGAAWLRCESGAFGDDNEDFVGVWWFPVPDSNDPYFDMAFYERNKNYNGRVMREVARRIGEWINVQEWAKTWDDYDRETLHEDMVRTMCLLLYSHHGGSSNSYYDEQEYYLFFQNHEDGEITCSAPLSELCDYALTHSQFETELRQFPKGFMMACPDISRTRLKSIDWSMLSGRVHQIESLLVGAKLPKDAVSAMLRSAARRLRTKDCKPVAPVNVEQLMQDADKLQEESVRERIKQLIAFVESMNALNTGGSDARLQLAEAERAMTKLNHELEDANRYIADLEAKIADCKDKTWLLACSSIDQDKELQQLREKNKELETENEMLKKNVQEITEAVKQKNKQGYIKQVKEINAKHAEELASAGDKARNELFQQICKCISKRYRRSKKQEELDTFSLTFSRIKEIDDFVKSLQDEGAEQQEQQQAQQHQDLQEIATAVKENGGNKFSDSAQQTNLIFPKGLIQEEITATKKLLN